MDGADGCDAVLDEASIEIPQREAHTSKQIYIKTSTWPASVPPASSTIGYCRVNLYTSKVIMRPIHVIG